MRREVFEDAQASAECGAHVESEADHNSLPHYETKFQVRTELSQRFQFTSQTYILMPTRGVPVDVEALPHLLGVPHAYLGVIGSRRRWAVAVQMLEARGVSRAALQRVHAPMGLELNAETPEEIALSILSEIVMLRRHGTGDSMKWLGSPDDAGA